MSQILVTNKRDLWRSRWGDPACQGLGSRSGSGEAGYLAGYGDGHNGAGGEGEREVCFQKIGRKDGTNCYWESRGGREVFLAMLSIYN